MTPGPQKRVILDDPGFRREDCFMQFRLTYEGRLLGASRNNTRADHKHEIRMQLAPQLKRLWEVTPWLDELKNCKFPDLSTAYAGRILLNTDWAHHKTYLQLVTENYQAFNRNWVPLIGEDMGLTCSLDILFLRPGSRGSLLNVGDIDGRLKTLFDALAMPKSGSGLPGRVSNDPVYVLMSDDRHISQVSVETDELLQPTSAEAGQNDARVVITVNIRALKANYMTLSFSSF